MAVNATSAGTQASTSHTVRVVELLHGPLRTSSVVVKQPASPVEPEWNQGATYVLFLRQATGIDQYEVVRSAEGRLLVSTDGKMVSSLSKSASGPQLDDLGIAAEPLDDIKVRIKSQP